MRNTVIAAALTLLVAATAGAQCVASGWIYWRQDAKVTENWEPINGYPTFEACKEHMDSWFKHQQARVAKGELKEEDRPFYACFPSDFDPRGRTAK